jgi:negative regulator of flagellin synthesis FlgM
MKIDNSNASLSPSSLGESTVRTPTPKAAETPPPQSGVNVTLGSATSQLRSMESNMSGTPNVDAKKVAEIKLAISEGRFQINSAAIADGLINNVEEMLSASQS